MDKFDWTNFFAGKLVVYHATKEQADDFALQAIFKRPTLAYTIPWDSIDSCARYHPELNKLVRASMGFYLQNGYEVVEWSDYMHSENSSMATLQQENERLAKELREARALIVSLNKELDKAAHVCADMEGHLHQVEAEFAAYRENSVRLPQDENGDVIHVGGKVIHPDVECECPAEVEGVASEWVYLPATRGGFWAIPSKDCTLVKGPYDKTGREIKVGDWVTVNGYAPYQVEEIKPGYKPDSHFVNAANDIWCWGDSTCRTPEYWEIVPEPDSAEKIREDAKKGSCSYFGNPAGNCDDCEHGSHQSGESCQRNMMNDLLDRALALGGTK